MMKSLFVVDIGVKRFVKYNIVVRHDKKLYIRKKSLLK